MYLFCLFAISLLIIGILILRIKRQSDYLELFALTVAVWFSTFIVISGLLFWINLFSFVGVLGLQIVFSMIILVVIRIKYECIVTPHYTKRPIVVYIILLASLVMTYEKFELFGMGQDQGVYQTNAIEFANDRFYTQFDFEEYSLLQDEQQKKEYAQILKEQNGLYRYTIRPTANEDGRISEVSAIYHGIPTFPAFLGLFAKIFGNQFIQLGQTFLYLAANIFVLLAVENLRLKKWTSILVLSISCFCPIIVWVSKASLTECGLCMLMAWYVYAITSKIDKFKMGCSVLAVTCFSFFHSSAFVLMPIFSLIYIILYIQTEENYVKISGVLSNILFYTGVIMMLCVTPQYGFDIIRANLKLPSDSYVIPVMAVFTLIFIFFILGTKKLRLDRLYSIVVSEKIFSFIIRVCIVVAILLVIVYTFGVYAGYVPVWLIGVQPYYESNNMVLIFTHITLYVLTFATGLVVLPGILLSMFIRPKKLLKPQNVILCVIFIYCVLVMAVLLKKEIFYFYYYARYLAPYIIVLVIFAGVCFDEFSDRVIQAALAISFLVMLPFDCFIATNKDQSQMTWDTLESICNVVEKDSAIVISDSYLLRLMLPLRAMTGCHVYPMFEDAEKQVKYLQENYKNIYIIDNDINSNLGSMGVPVYIESFEVQTYKREETALLVPFPLKTNNHTETIYMSTLNGLDYIDSMSTIVGTVNENGIHSTGTEGFVMYGPYIDLGKGTYTIEISGHVETQLDTYGWLDIVSNQAQEEILVPIEIAKWVNENGDIQIQIPIEIKEDSENFEIRLYVNEGVKISIEHVRINPVQY